MMEKYQEISALAEKITIQVAKNEISWKKYLDMAARLYRYSFEEQLLIYAQRPDATACASIEVWNEKMHCWVNKYYTDKKEAGSILVEMCKGIKTGNAFVSIGEYAGFKIAASFNSINNKFVMSLKGQLSYNIEVGTDPFGNITRINHALESITTELADAKLKLKNVERQLETAKVEVTKPFAQEVELSEKLDRLSALNALLNMDEKSSDEVNKENDASKHPELTISPHKISIKSKLQANKALIEHQEEHKADLKRSEQERQYR